MCLLLAGAVDVREKVIMAKKIEGYIKLNIPAGGANPSPPVGPALGQLSVFRASYWIAGKRLKFRECASSNNQTIV